jgi:hypothetical protein
VGRRWLRPWLLALCAGLFAPSAAAAPVYLGTPTRGGLDPAVVRAFRASLERALARRGVPVLDASSSEADSLERSTAEARAALEDAKAAYAEEDWGRAVQATRDALQAFERGPAFTADEDAWLLYRDILSLRAVVLLELRRKREAEDALRALLIVMPRYAPRRDRAPAELLRRLEDVKDEIRSLPPVSLEIRSKPAGGEVTLDGRRRGRAPLLVEELVPGVHYLAVEGDGGRYVERVEIGEDGARVAAQLATRKTAGARDVVAALDRPQKAEPFTLAVGEVEEDALLAVLLPAGKKVEVIGARVRRGQVRVVCGVRVENTENDRERATFLLTGGLLERERDAWLDDAAGEDPSALRTRFFEGLGTTIEEEPPREVSPAVIAVSVLAGLAAATAIGAGIGIYVTRELKKDEGFTWAVDTSGL